MNPCTAIIVILGVASITFLAMSLYLTFKIDDLQLENAKLRIDLLHK